MDDDASGDVSVYEFFELFPDEQAAIDFLEAERWPDGVVCPRCDSNRTRRIAKSNYHNCKDCRKQFTVRAGSIFERSRIPLHKWLFAMYLVQTSRKGISSVQLSKELGITQRSAWFMLHRLRVAMMPGDDQLSGVVEIDETFVGGNERNKHSKKKLRENWMAGKQVVLGMRERGGSIIAWPIHSTTRDVMDVEILHYVEKGSVIYTDESRSYYNIGKWYEHEKVNHKRGEYVNGEVTTNGIESVWAVLKRAHKGVYHQWSRKHGHRYVNEIAFRLVEGSVKNPIMVRIKHLVQKSFSVRITYRELTYSEESGGFGVEGE